jgi:glycosyltransferase involved in cell wall biosynthesis
MTYSILYKSHYPWSDFISRYTYLALSLAINEEVASLRYIEPMRFISNESLASVFPKIRYLFGYSLVDSQNIPIYSGINPVPFRKRSGFTHTWSRRWEKRCVRSLLGSLEGEPNPILLVQGPTEFSETLLDGANRKGIFTIFDWANLYEKDAASAPRQAVIARLSREFSEKSDFVVTVSDQITEMALKFNPMSYTLRDAVPLKFIAKKPNPPRKERLNTPTIAYFGLINPTKLDYCLIKTVARLKPTWQFEYIGPQQGTKCELYRNLPSNVKVRPPMDGNSLHEYIREYVDLTFIPYNKEDMVAYYCSPLKLYEALAHGLGVVSTITFDPADALPFMSRADDPKELVTLMEEALESDSIEKRKERIAYAQKNTWEHRAEELITLIKNQISLR